MCKKILKYNDVVRLAAGGPSGSGNEELERYRDLCDACVELANKNELDMVRPWEITELARIFLCYARFLERYEHMVNYLYSAVSKMLDCVYDHPRLKLELLCLQLAVCRDIEAVQMHDLSITEEVEDEIRFYQRNIEFADSGRLDQIRDRGVLRSDPVEWTARWEEVVDEADKIAYANLEDVPRSMGFCHALWSERREALARFGIDWKSPRIMNPKVMFD